MIVVIEGADGVGKTTCIKTLIQKYNYKPFPTAFPTYKLEKTSATPMHVRTLLKDYLMEGKREEIGDFLFQMANVVDKVVHAPLIEELNQSTDIYLVDRYRTTGYVYGVTSMIESKTFDEYTIRMICEESLKLIPTVTLEVLLWADPRILMQRIELRNEVKSTYERYAFLDSLCQEFKNFYSRHPKINQCTVWADQEPDDLAKCVDSSIRAFLELPTYVESVIHAEQIM